MERKLPYMDEWEHRIWLDLHFRELKDVYANIGSEEVRHDGEEHAHAGELHLRVPQPGVRQLEAVH